MNFNRLTFHTNPPTLPEISSINVAISLWHQEILYRWSTGKITQIFELFAAFRHQTKFRLPAHLCALLDGHIELVRKEIESWIMYHSTRIFNNRHICTIQFLIDFFERIVWRNNGIIDYEATARNMLQNNHLSEFEKYCVACTYCFEEDVVISRNMVRETVRSDNIVLIQHSLVYYWEYRLTDKISVIPRDIPDFFDTSIMDWPAIDNWPAVRYFWNHLDENEQATEAVKIITRYPDAKFTPQLLKELTEQQFIYVVEQTATFMMLRLINNSTLDEYTYQIWLHVRHIINPDQFFELIRGILNAKIRFSGALSNDEVSLRIKIWTSANDDLKQAALIRLIRENTSFQYRGSLKKLSREVRFLINILSEASFEQRNFVWRQNWSNLIYGTSPFFLNHLMYMCLETPEDIALFKREILSDFDNIKKYCLELAEERLFTELNNFLDFCCSSDPEQILSLKHQILQSCFSGEILFLNYHILRDLDKLTEFIDEVFQNDDLARNFKSQLVLLPANIEFIRYVIENGDLALVKNLFSSFLPSEPDSKWMKLHFLDLCRSSLSSANFWKFEVSEWEEFIEWCAGSEYKVREFKRSIRLENVFETVLSRCFEFQSHTHFCNDYMTCDSDTTLYTLLDNFLVWYFGRPESIKRFKLNKIQRYDEIKVLKRIFAEGEECLIRDMLKWVFNDDVEEIEKFRENLLVRSSMEF